MQTEQLGTAVQGHQEVIKIILYAAKVVRQRGPGFFWTYFRESMLFDLHHGTRTSARVPKDEQSIESGVCEQKEGLLYVASFTSVTRDSVSIARAYLGESRFAGSQFVDLGCGKGKALLVHALNDGRAQAHVPVGIEYDPRLVEQALGNAAKCGFTENTMKVVADSATNVMSYVSAPVLVVYLYNSFRGETLRKVLKELAAVPHVLIYVDPAEREMLDRFDYTVIHDQRGRYNADTWLVAAHGLQCS